MRSAMNYRRLLIYGALFCALLLPLPVLAQNTPPNQLQLVDVDTSSFPELAVRFNLIDGAGQPVRNLRAEDLNLTIDERPITTTLQLDSAVRAPAVTIVADLSAAMDDQSTPGYTRRQDMVTQVKRLFALIPPDAPVALVTFDSQASVAFPWRADGGGLRNTLDELSSRLATSSPDAPYALSAAIALGLEQFSVDDSQLQGRPRALFVYTAGVPNHAIDTAALQPILDRLRPNLPSLTIVGLGSSTDGQFIRQPGNPEQ